MQCAMTNVEKLQRYREGRTLAMANETSERCLSKPAAYAHIPTVRQVQALVYDRDVHRKQWHRSAVRAGTLATLQSERAGRA